MKILKLFQYTIYVIQLKKKSFSFARNEWFVQQATECFALGLRIQSEVESLT